MRYSQRNITARIKSKSPRYLNYFKWSMIDRTEYNNFVRDCQRSNLFVELLCNIVYRRF